MTPPIAFQEPHYANAIKLFGRGPGTRPRKALSHQMDRTYAEALKDARATLTGFPQLQELNDEISTLEESLGRASISQGLASYWPINIRVPELAICTPK